MAITESTSIVVYCQHPILMLGLRNLFFTCPDIRMEFAETPEDTIRLVAQINPDLVLLDSAGGLDLALLKGVKQSSPAVKPVLWLDSISAEEGFQAVNLGVRGILWKTLKPEDFLDHLRGIYQGHTRIEDELMNSIQGMRSIRLTKRESELVALLAQGLKNKEIATELHIAENTVKAYLSRLFQKVNVKDRLDLALYALKNLPQGNRAAPGPSRSNRPPAVNHPKPVTPTPYLSSREI